MLSTFLSNPIVTHVITALISFVLTYYLIDPCMRKRKSKDLMSKLEIQTQGYLTELTKLLNELKKTDITNEDGKGFVVFFKNPQYKGLHSLEINKKELAILLKQSDILKSSNLNETLNEFKKVLENFNSKYAEKITNNDYKKIDIQIQNIDNAANLLDCFPFSSIFQLAFIELEIDPSNLKAKQKERDGLIKSLEYILIIQKVKRL